VFIISTFVKPGILLTGGSLAVPGMAAVAAGTQGTHNVNINKVNVEGIHSDAENDPSSGS